MYLKLNYKLVKEYIAEVNKIDINTLNDSAVADLTDKIIMHNKNIESPIIIEKKTTAMGKVSMAEPSVAWVEFKLFKDDNIKEETHELLPIVTKTTFGNYLVVDRFEIIKK